MYDKAGLAALIKGHDAVITSVHYTASDPALLLEAVRESGVKRYFVVGGAGSLEVAPGVRLIDTPQFPALYKAEAIKGAEFLELLRTTPATSTGPSCRQPRCSSPASAPEDSASAWTSCLSNDKGSSISFEDYAIAAVDELEKPAHIRERFTVGY